MSLIRQLSARITNPIRAIHGFRCISAFSTTCAKQESFAELLDSSPLMQLGRPNGKCVVGKVTAICNQDIYVDFGGKFEAVVQKSPRNKDDIT